jgi:hypothetical protein
VRRALLALLAVALLAGGLVGCGVPQDDAPRTLDRSAAPFRVFERDVPAQPQGELEVELWFLRGDQAVAVPRPLELPGSPAQVLQQLLDGPTRAELAAGLSSAVPGPIDLVQLVVVDRVAVVTLDGLNEQVQVPAYAQMVATLDGRPEISGVRFRTPDGDVQVPDGEGELRSGALSRTDYGVLLGLVPPPNGLMELGPAETAPAPDPEPSPG